MSDVPDADEKQKQKQPDRMQNLALIITSITALAALGSSAATGYALVYTSASVRAGQEQLRLAERGQTTERYSRAVEQLGHTALDVRVGGIYALERIMRDSSQDQPMILEVLEAFIRVHSATRGRPPAIERVTAEQLLPAAPADIQAALNVIRRRDHNRDAGHIIDLSYTKLFGADLSGAYLVGAEMEGADLTGAKFFRSNLSKAHLLSANLSFASCRWAQFTEAGMVKTILVNTFLYDANLNGARLNYAVMRQTLLGGATFVGADLKDAQISDTSSANFAGAKR